MGTILIPERHARVVIRTVYLLTVDTALVLDLHLERLLKAHWVRNIPSIEPVLASLHLDIADVSPGIQQSDLPASPGAAVLIFRSGGVRKLVAVNGHNCVTLAPPSRVVRSDL